jgi:hypothetical protein
MKKPHLRHTLFCITSSLLIAFSFNSCSTFTNSFKKDTGYGGGLYYQASNSASAIQLVEKVNKECILEVYTRYKEPAGAYCITRTCLYNNNTYVLNKGKLNIEIPQSCA